MVRIGQSEPAPSFKLIAQPNDWEKAVRAVTSQTEPTGKQALYRTFWGKWIDLVHSDHPEWSRATRAPHYSWFPMSTGTVGAAYYTSFTKRGLSSELVFEAPNGEANLALFRQLLAHREPLEAAYGQALDWQELPHRKSTRVAEYLPDADVAHEQAWPEYLTWLADRQARLRSALSAIGGIPALPA